VKLIRESHCPSKNMQRFSITEANTSKPKTKASLQAGL